jgi:hypothetical protein
MAELEAALAELKTARAEVGLLKQENKLLRTQQENQLLGPLLHKQTGGATDGRADDLKSKSYQMTGDKRNQESWVKMAQNRAHVRGAGFTEDDFTKPIITVAVSYSNALECNNMLLDLARTVVHEIEITLICSTGGPAQAPHCSAPLGVQF